MIPFSRNALYLPFACLAKTTPTFYDGSGARDSGIASRGEFE
jgi:hypothetical protein